MNCPRTLKRLPLYAGGDLDLREKAEVDAHLQGCLSCYREFAAYRDVLQQVTATSARRVPLASTPFGASFTDDVMGQIDGPPPVQRWRPRLVMLSGWAAAAALALMFIWGSGPAPIEGDGTPATVRSPLVDSTPSERSEPVVPVELEPWMPLRPVDGASDMQLHELMKQRRDPRSMPVSLPVRQIQDF